jgi:hypothetical protein
LAPGVGKLVLGKFAELPTRQKPSELVDRCQPLDPGKELYAARQVVQHESLAQSSAAPVA